MLPILRVSTLWDSWGVERKEREREEGWKWKRRADNLQPRFYMFPSGTDFSFNMNAKWLGSGGRVIGFQTRTTYEPAVVVLPLLEFFHRFLQKNIGDIKILLTSNHTDFYPLCISVQFTAPIRKYQFFSTLFSLISHLQGLKDWSTLFFWCHVSQLPEHFYYTVSKESLHQVERLQIPMGY